MQGARWRGNQSLLPPTAQIKRKLPMVHVCTQTAITPAAHLQNYKDCITMSHCAVCQAIRANQKCSYITHARGAWRGIKLYCLLWLGLRLLFPKSCLLFYSALLQKLTDYGFRFTYYFQLFLKVAMPTSSLAFIVVVLALP